VPHATTYSTVLTLFVSQPLTEKAELFYQPTKFASSFGTFQTTQTPAIAQILSRLYSKPLHPLGALTTSASLKHSGHLCARLLNLSLGTSFITGRALASCHHLPHHILAFFGISWCATLCAIGSFFPAKSCCFRQRLPSQQSPLSRGC
jgi:hypothetical protein